ncbi:hypothetical protein Sjap_012192 [Stephania japonica]|uniref:VQ domain-containing protein n=1 Tax=Stephania japonica TaxID=461633 RepID=A0AAP0NYN4_9MAGN
MAALQDSLMMNLEPWTTTNFNSISDLWTNNVDLFNRETETLTKALQISLSSGSETLDDAASFHYHRIGLPEIDSFPAPPTATATTSGSDPESLSTTAENRRQSSILSSVSNRKIAKRKSRGAKRSSTTTFIAADAANFRQMVQQVTGKRFGEGGHVAAAEEVLRPAASRRPSEWMLQSCHLPTLDTSAVLLKNQLQLQVENKQSRQSGEIGTVVLPERHVAFADLASGAGFDQLEKFHQSFPTLESWGVM